MSKIFVLPVDPSSRVPYRGGIITGYTPVEVSNDKEARHLINNGLLKITEAQVKEPAAKSSGTKSGTDGKSSSKD